MRVVILHSEAQPEERPDELDDALQVASVRHALERAGHEVSALGAGLDLATLARELTRRAPDLVFNLVETIDRRGRLACLASALVEALGVRITGCPSLSIVWTSDKLAAKRTLRAAGIDTPDWFDPATGVRGVFEPGERWIVKSRWEHASIGLDEGSIVVPRTETELGAEVARRGDRLGGEAFAERFVDGREMNAGLVGPGPTPLVLPLAEILFEGFTPGVPKIVGYRAKWETSSFEYINTPRTFEFPPGDSDLLARVARAARRCWDLFGLSGYARVDFRVDAHARPWVLELNANPCISPDAGLAAMAQRAGLTHDRLVLAIVESAMRRPAGVCPDAPEAGATGARRAIASPGEVVVRAREPREEDERAVRDIVESTGFFRADEVEIACELVRERLSRGMESGYNFLFADPEGGMPPVGYACFGPIGCAPGSYDLYWIAVHQSRRGAGLGRRLAREVERAVAGLGGRRVYAETSGKAQYAPTRDFYLACGYRAEASLPDFYAPGDHKVVFARTIE